MIDCIGGSYVIATSRAAVITAGDATM